MYRNWIVRKGAPSIKVDEKSKTVLVSTARRVSISSGDVLILLNEEYVFTHIAEVVETAPLRGSVQDPDMRKTTEITHSGWRALDAPVEFELFTSSLTFVTNRERPYLHLRLGYRTLADADLETIQGGEPFLAREAYLALLGALPESLKRTYLAEQLLAQGAGNEAPYEQRTISLLQFIESRILKIGEMIVVLDEEWEEVRKLADVALAVEPVFSSEDELVAPDNIRKQADQFRKVQNLIRTGQESPTMLELTREAMQSEGQRARVERFEEVFSGLAL
jgi:hypothetical protein